MDETGPGNLIQVQTLLNSEGPVHGMSSCDKKSRLLLVTMVGLFLLAGAVRLYRIKTPGLALDREYRSALIARAYYLKATDSAPGWRRDVAVASAQRQGSLEPPAMELLVASIYRIVDGEHLWIGRFLASVTWLAGGVILLKVVQRIVSLEGAICSTAYYLFVPPGVMASRSFQPDSLMIMIFLLGLYNIIRYHDQPSMIRLVKAAVISGCAVLVKPLVLFALLGAFLSLTILRKADLKRLADGHSITFIAVCLLPAAVYYGYGMFIADALKRQAQVSFLPQLLLSLGYWRQWLLTAVGAVGYTALGAGLVGLPMLPKGMPRTLLIGLWIGYFVFCLVFTNHIRFAEYYHLQLIVIVSLSFSFLASLIINQLKISCNKWYWWTPVIGTLILVLLLNIREVRGRLAAPRLLESEEMAKQVGEIVGHSSKIVFVSYHYGTPLQYYGELSGSYWPRSISDRDHALGVTRLQSVEERLNALGFSPEYFVITDFGEYNRYHSDLKDYLASKCHLVTKSVEYLVYGACRE